MSFTVPFMIFNVFTSSAEGGNPAAVVFLPTSKPKKSAQTLQEIATSLDQPITVFISNSDDVIDRGVARFDVRWFTSTREMPIDGHGLIAAAAALFSDFSHKLESFGLSPGTTSTQFQSPDNVTLTARRRSLANWYELELPASLTTRIPLDSDEGQRLGRVVMHALGREHDDEGVITYIGKGGTGYENYLMVELDNKVDLGACEVDINVLTEMQPYTICVLTSEGRQFDDVTFVSRTFAPTAGLPEDHVCGPAHALLTPYYTLKRRVLSHTPSQPGKVELQAKQVSKRGGYIRATWDEERGIVKIAGEVVQTGSGSWVYKSVDKHDLGTYVYKDGWKTSYTW